LRSFEKIAGFDDSRPFRPWFLQSVVNDSIKAVLKQKRQLSLPDDDEDAELKGVMQAAGRDCTEPEEVLQRRQLMDEIQSAISRLSPAQRAVIVMHYFLGISTKEMAVKMDVEAGTIRWHLSQARKRLRSFYLHLNERKKREKMENNNQSIGIYVRWHGTDPGNRGRFVARARKAVKMKQNNFHPKRITGKQKYAFALAIVLLLFGSLACVPNVRAFAEDIIQQMGIAFMDTGQRDR